jgi:hypothetical protein
MLLSLQEIDDDVEESVLDLKATSSSASVGLKYKRREM